MMIKMTKAVTYYFIFLTLSFCFSVALFAAPSAADELACKEKLINSTLNCASDTQCQGTKICSCQNFLSNPTGEVLSCQAGASPCAGSGHPICIRPEALIEDPAKPGTGTMINTCAIGYRNGLDATSCAVKAQELVTKYTPCFKSCYQGPATYELLAPKTRVSAAVYKLKNPNYNADLCNKCTSMLIPDKLLSGAPSGGTIGWAPPNSTIRFPTPPNWCTENILTALYNEFGQLKCRNACSACFSGVNDLLYKEITAIDNDNDKIPEISPDLLRLTGLNISQTDNCPEIANPTQKDLNKNNKGCECDPDEICVNTGNVDVCDISKPRPVTPPVTDPDCDGIPNFPISMIDALRLEFGNDFKIDNCPNHYNPFQIDLNKNGEGCQCDDDEECAWQSPLCTSLRGNNNCTMIREQNTHQRRINSGT